jgi:hypothetical protein
MEKSIVQKSIGRKSIVRKRASYREALAEKSIVQNENSSAHGVTGSRCSMKAHCSMTPLRGTTKQKAKRKMARSDHGAKRFSRPRRPKNRWNKQKAQLLITERHRHGISNAKAWARVSPKKARRTKWAPERGLSPFFHLREKRRCFTRWRDAKVWAHDLPKGKHGQRGKKKSSMIGQRVLRDKRWMHASSRKSHNAGER